jgi:galactokinase
LGAGLSSSAALECLIAFIFNEDFYSKDKTQLALDAQLAERKYVGVNCGIMDQFAIANGKQHQAILLNCATLEYEYIPADFKDYQLVIINSNKARALAESKYNERRKECDAAYELLSKFDIAADLCHVHEISLAYLEDDILYQRAKHAILENKRVIHAVDALRNGRIEAFGQLLTESHISLDTDYEVSGFELNMIVHYSTHFEGCIGARMTGAGFGGCCIALVQKDKTNQFISYVGKKYSEKTGLKADFYLAEISDGVRKL